MNRLSGLGRDVTNPVRGKSRVFHTLDGLRGVAAVVVAMRHTSFFHDLNAFGGYMAVDLFFVLSGFVIAHAYQGRLAEGLSAGRFLALRYLRLWPVYVVGTAFGLIAAGFQALPDHYNLTPRDMLHVAPMAIAMLPGPIVTLAIYPVNSVAWSLALELIANFVYGLCWRQLRRPVVLVTVLGAAAIALIASTLWYGRLDVGSTWLNAPGGLPRVAFSFTAGVALYRLFEAKAWRLRVWPWAPLLILPPLFWTRLDLIVWPLTCVLVVFPVLIFAGASSDPGPRSARIFAWLGLVSYPLYALHEPIGELVTYGLRTAAPVLAGQGVIVGVPCMLALLVVCGLVERYYDQPVRGALTRWFQWVLQRFARRPIGSSLLDQRRG